MRKKVDFSVFWGPVLGGFWGPNSWIDSRLEYCFHSLRTWGKIVNQSLIRGFWAPFWVGFRGFRRFWEVLGGFGRFLGGFGEDFDGFGSFWEVFKGFGVFSRVSSLWLMVSWVSNSPFSRS